MKKLVLIFSLCLFTSLLTSCGGESKDSPEMDAKMKEIAAKDSIEKANMDGYRQAINAFLKGDKETITKLVDANLIDHNPDTMLTKKKGAEGMIEMMDMLNSMQSDMTCEITQIMAEGDFVYVWGKMGGKMLIDMPGMKSKGKSFNVDFSEITRIKDGKMVERWGLMDQMTMMAQLGMKMM